MVVVRDAIQCSECPISVIFFNQSEAIKSKETLTCSECFFVVFFFFHAFRLLHVPTSRFDYSACTVIDRTITSRKTAAN